MDLMGMVGIVTGASGQLGGAIARFLAGRGMDCVCHYHTGVDQVEGVINEIEQLGRRAVAVQVDLSQADAAGVIFDQAAALGDVRVLVNSASLFQRQPLGTYSEADVAMMLGVNLTAPMMLCDAFARYLKAEGCLQSEATAASIINLVDVAGVKPWGGYGPYCATRAGLIGLTKSLAKELAPGVTVNAIAPGIVTWPGKMDASEEAKQLAMIPAGRFGEPADITRTIDFLLDNTYITGQVLCVDGGRSL